MSSRCYYKPDPIPRLENIYTYKGATEIRPKQYDFYTDIKGGEIQYYKKQWTALDTYQKSPLFQNEAFISSRLYRDPMGSLKPEYNRVQVKNNLASSQLTWMQDSCEWREEIIAKQLRRDNQTRYDPRWNFS